MDLWNYADRRTQEKNWNERNECLCCFWKLMIPEMEWKNYSASAAANLLVLNNRT